MTIHRQNDNNIRRAISAISGRIYLALILAAIAIVMPLQSASAFSPETYVQKSRLADGSWIKISVPSTGLYRLTPATLKRWGFKNPEKVRIFGSGGAKMKDELTPDALVDDLRPVASANGADGVVFYAVGPETLSVSSRGSISATCNIYSSYAYYFVTETDGSESPSPASTTATPADDEFAVTEFTDYVQHERDLTAPGQCGPQLMGEDFRYTPSRRIQFTLPGVVAESEVLIESHFAAKTYNYPSVVQFSVNGTEIPVEPTNSIPSTSSSSDLWAKSSVIRNSFVAPGEKIDLGIEFKASSVVYGAWLDYVSLTYHRKLDLSADGALCFTLRPATVKLDGVKSAEALTIWDVTDPSSVLAVEAKVADGSATWKKTLDGERKYVAWNTGAKLPEPSVIGIVPNQNLHGLEPVDMVIFAPSSYVKESRRIAKIHEDGPDALKVAVVDVEQVYNEFSSGMPDICGLRNFLKMLYDRGLESENSLKYALLVGRTTYDSRHIASETASNGFPTLPTWYDSRRETSFDPIESYGTDDFFAMLEDGGGRDLTRDYMSIAVGRLPVTSLSNLKSYIDKLNAYVSSSTKTPWKNRILLLADDQEGGTFADDMENFAKALGDNSSKQFMMQKVYIDRYHFVNGKYPEARKEMFRQFNDGVAWWIYAGHANDHSMTEDGQFTYDDINNNMYLRNVPFLLAVTCKFLKWDGNNESGGEILFNERYGGVIGVISATRAAYITYNGYLATAFARELDARDSSGRLIPAGEVYRRAKNNILDSNGNRVYNANKLRYVFMGDPAMRTVTPHRRIEVTSLGGVDIATAEEAPNISARQKVTVTGHILDLDGNPDTNYEGTVLMDLYDAEKSVTTIGRGDGREVNFEAHGDKLYAGSGLVKDGAFSIQFTMPEEIADNYRNALVNFYAYDKNGDNEAISIFTDFFITGEDTEAPADTQSPVIESLVLNHESFSPGTTVNTSPMLLARISDDTGINVSSSGVGRSMSLLIDGKKSYNDLSFYYTPFADGSIGGEIAYPVDALTEGEHTLRMRVWDISGNMAEKEITFNVREGLAPEIFEIYADQNPAREQTNFYIRHNQPDCTASVTVTVYNMLGQPVWSGTQKGRSDMFLTTPVNWNLCDNAGRRVPRGIYVYSATVTTDGIAHRTASKKLAVTAQ